MEQAEASVKARLGLSRFANRFANGSNKRRIVAIALGRGESVSRSAARRSHSSRSASIAVTGRKMRS